LLKRTTTLILLVMLLVSMVLTFQKPLVGIVQAATLPKKYPVVYVYPENVSVNVGQTFSIAIIVYNLTDTSAPDPDNPSFSTIKCGNLYGFDIEFTWDSTVIKYVNSTNLSGGAYTHPNVTVPMETYPNPIPPSPYKGILHSPTLLIKNIVKETGNIQDALLADTRAWFSYASMLPAVACNGNGTLFTMKFKVLKAGTSALHFNSVKLANSTGFPIAQGSADTWLNAPRDGLYKTPGQPVASFTYSPSLGAANKTETYTASVTGNLTKIKTYMWDFGDGAKQNTTVPTVQHSYTTGSTYTVSLKVLDQNDYASDAVTRSVKIATRRDLKATSISLSNSTVYPNTTITVNMRVDNLGTAPFTFSENVTSTLYFNSTSFDLGNPASGAWTQADVNLTLIAKGSYKNIKFTLNSLSLPSLGSWYYFLLNVTGVTMGYESNVTNNIVLSTPLEYTGLVIHQPEVNIINYGHPYNGTYVMTIIEGEDATVFLNVTNSGNSADTINVTLLANGSPIAEWQLDDLAVGETTSLNWTGLLGAGDVNVTAMAVAGGVSDSSQVAIRIVLTPSLAIETQPQQVLVKDQTVLNASTSVHQDPEGAITLYTWEIFAPGADHALYTVATNTSTTTYAFNQTGTWTIILTVTDSFGLTYTTDRNATAPYRLQTTVEVKTIKADLNGDGEVTIQDVVLAGSQYWLLSNDPEYDSTIVALADLAPPYDGFINILDMLTLVSHYADTTW